MYPKESEYSASAIQFSAGRMQWQFGLAVAHAVFHHRTVFWLVNKLYSGHLSDRTKTEGNRVKTESEKNRHNKEINWKKSKEKKNTRSKIHMAKCDQREKKTAKRSK